MRITPVALALALVASWSLPRAVRADAYHPHPTPDALQPTLDASLPSYEPSGQYTGQLKAVTSQTIEFVLRRWIEAFKQVQPGIKITFEPSGGEPAANSLNSGKADIGIITREMSPQGLQAFVRTYGYSPLPVPICGGSFRQKSYSDAMTFIVNKDNPLDKITYAELDVIFSADHKRGHPPLANWGDLGVTGPLADKPIHPWTIKAWDGFEEFIRQQVLAGGEFRPAIYQTDDGTRPLSAEVANDPCAISLDSLAWVGPGVKHLKIAVDPKGPYHELTAEEVFNWKWPLARKLYAYINREPGTEVKPALKEFLRFIISKEGQQCVIDDKIYVPLNAEMSRKSEALIR